MDKDTEQKINHMEVEFSALKEKVSFCHVIYGKLDVTLSKLQEIIEDRRSENNDEIREVYQSLQKTEEKILTEIKGFNVKIEEQSRKIDEIDRWRWLVIGGAVVVGWLIAVIFK